MKTWTVKFVVSPGWDPCAFVLVRGLIVAGYGPTFLAALENLFCKLGGRR